MEKTYTKTSLRLRFLLTFAALALYVSAQGDGLPANGNSYRLIELKAEHLPSLNIARTGHETFCLDGELTVFGGHTDGFIPTATAEYLHDGVWQTLPLVYSHDQGVAIGLRSGKVFLAGGHKEPLGIGQLFSAELYDPTSHTCHGFGCMCKKRAFANGIEMADGQVLISGNWFEDDGMEMFSNVFDPKCTNAIEVKETSLSRAKPYILRISDDDAIVFSSLDDKAKPVADYGMVDRLKGPAYREPFLDTWHPIHTIQVRRSLNQFIGDEAEGRYEWLVPVENDETREVAIARVKGSEHDGDNATFSLLPTEQPLPDSIHGKHIIYSSLVCDHGRGLAYLIGDNDEARIIVVCIRYDSPNPSPVTIYDAGSQSIKAASVTPVLTPEGDLVFAGGYLHSNFSPSNTVILLPLGHASAVAANAPTTSYLILHNSYLWLWIIIPCLLACIAGAVLLVKRRRPRTSLLPTEDPDTDEPAEDILQDDSLPKDEALADMMKRIDRMMEEEQPYLNANLRVSDVAVRVGSNTTYVSAAINSQRGCTFSQYLTAYRIAYAQKMMRQSPERKISDVSALSGFSTESTFFRAFRTSTGMSPKEWLAAQDNQQP